MLSINSHLFLRRPEPSDAAVFYQYKNDPSVISSLGGFHHGLTLSNINHWIDKQSSHDSQIIWSIVFSSSNHCIGHVGFYNIDYRIRCAEFGILIGDKEFQGKGIGFQVTHYLLNYGFYNLNLNRISLTVLSTNSAAIQLYKKCGFIQEGVLRQAQFKDNNYIDLLCFSVLRNEL